VSRRRVFFEVGVVPVAGGALCAAVVIALEPRYGELGSSLIGVSVVVVLVTASAVARLAVLRRQYRRKIRELREKAVAEFDARHRADLERFESSSRALLEDVRDEEGGPCR
jgi:hypothetical protein